MWNWLKLHFWTSYAGEEENPYAPPRAEVEPPGHSVGLSGRFTDRLRKIVRFAKQAAGTDSLVRPEHLLWGLLREGSGVATFILRDLGADVERMRSEIEAFVGEPASKPEDTLFSTEAKQVIDRSAEEARQLDHEYIGSEHLLLALLHEPSGIVALIMQRHRTSYDQVRAKLVAIMAN
jgi:ATP-dependent Clp protease ATP-binding subunit ClpC